MRPMHPMHPVQVLATMPELPKARRARYAALGLPMADVVQLADEPTTAAMFDAVLVSDLHVK